MYKLLLCWRYLRTRYIALASIVSVTLGVATMIVVNSVMAGFNLEMQQRIHGILSDIVFESRSLSGFQDPQYHMDEIRRVAGDDVVGMTPTIIVPGMLSFQVRGETITRQVNLIGIDQQTHAQVSDFSQFLQHPANREALSFDLRVDGYDQHDHQLGPGSVTRPQMEIAGWKHRQWQATRRKEVERSMAPAPDAIRPSNPFAADDLATAGSDGPAGDSTPATTDGTAAVTPDGNPAAADPGAPLDSERDIFSKFAEPEKVFDPQNEQHTGAVLGIALANYRTSEGKEGFLLLPGDDVTLLVPTAGNPPKGSMDNFTVVDFYESKMSEYDSAFVFVPLAKLQAMRGMDGKTTGVASVTAIQIRLRPGADGDEVCRRLRATFPPELYGVQTWRDKQGPLLAAVQMETAILNVLLFMIIAVAGFGILAIFFMIVVEKTRDIGILKSLGAFGGRNHGHLSGLWLVAGHRRLGGRNGAGAVVRRQHQPDRPAARSHYRSRGVRSSDLLLPTDSDFGRSADGRVDRRRGDVDRGLCQYFAGPSGRPPASCGGFAYE